MALVKGIRRAIQIAGGQSKLQRLVGAKSPQVVQGWFSKGKCPPHWAKKVEAATGVPVEELCPEVFAPLSVERTTSLDITQAIIVESHPNG